MPRLSKRQLVSRVITATRLETKARLRELRDVGAAAVKKRRESNSDSNDESDIWELGFVRYPAGARERGTQGRTAITRLKGYVVPLGLAACRKGLPVGGFQPLCKGY